MKILALDSSSESATVAVLDDNKLLSEMTFNYKKQHSVIMLPMIDECLKNTGLTIDNIDGFVASKGPGSFTGLRIGMSTVKGLAQGTKKPFITICSLDALANNLCFADGIICPIMDALRGNVYSNLYSFDNSSMSIVAKEEPQIISMDDLIEKLKALDTKIYFVGDATYKYREKLEENLDNIFFAPSHLNVVKASSLGEIGIKHLENGESDNVLSACPIYLRLSQAEREYEEKHGKDK